MPRTSQNLGPLREQLVCDWEPALQEIPRFSASPVFSGKNVQSPFKETDKDFTISIVLLF